MLDPPKHTPRPQTTLARVATNLSPSTVLSRSLLLILIIRKILTPLRHCPPVGHVPRTRHSVASLLTRPSRPGNPFPAGAVGAILGDRGYSGGEAPSAASAPTPCPETGTGTAVVGVPNWTSCACLPWHAGACCVNVCVCRGCKGGKLEEVDDIGEVGTPASAVRDLRAPDHIGDAAAYVSHPPPAYTSTSESELDTGLISNSDDRTSAELVIPRHWIANNVAAIWTILMHMFNAYVRHTGERCSKFQTHLGNRGGQPR